MSIRSRAAASSPMEGAIHGGWGVNRQYDRAKISVQFSISGDFEVKKFKGFIKMGI